MIRITGDAHGEEFRFTDEYMPRQTGWDAEDKLIVTGDFGFVFHGEKRYLAERNKLNALAKKPYEILFVDGNHEGFDYLVNYPEELRYGAPVRRIRDNIFWLQRGYLYTIEGKTFFTMGGAYSMDKAFRMSYQESCGEKIWFEQELPSAEEYHRAIDTLKNCHMKVEYIITHTAPKSIIPRVIGKMPDSHDAELTGFLDWIYHEVDFKQWFFGHFHEDQVVTDQMIACFQQLHEL